ncbi:signal peptidase I [Pedobacter polaris]|uniref:Signal peptidase I n=1 Tax=Pedobacter polaris TaxID=2571273 RepID=A0A4V5P2E5_9SPHI|nr:signal peptidase I [Pedobacter polaris]TKC12412.1 signal peptidase I [Pedobacter polaris]
MKIRIKKNLKNIVVTFFLFFSTLLVIRSCFLDVFNIPSNSMNDKLFVSDKVIINKTHYSGLLSGILKWLNAKDDLQPRDILVFKLDSNEKSFYIKRCIALPGQNIEILNEDVKVNGSKFNEDSHVLFRFKIFYKSYHRLERFFSKAGIDYFNADLVRNSNYLSLNLNLGEYKLLIESMEVDSIQIDVPTTKTAKSTASKRKFDVNNLQLIKIPYKGMTIKLNAKNYRVYNVLIKKYEGFIIKLYNDEFRLNGKKITTYTFKKDYIFVLGDNRNNSKDSRHYGPIPISNVTGKYMFKLANNF